MRFHKITQLIIKLNVIIFPLFLFSFLAVALASEPTLPKASYVSTQTVKEWLNQGKPLLLIDVRQPEEYEKGHIEGAINLPYEKVEENIPQLNPEVPLIFYCISSSWRAPYSANLLKDHGFKEVYILEGGIVAWKGGGQTIRSSRKNQKPSIAPYPKHLKIALHHPKDKIYPEKLNFTAEELKLFDGKEGRSAYVVIDGKIYDVTQSRLWRGGEHAPSHKKVSAGQDLTHLIRESPHGVKELKKFPVVGRLVWGKK